MKENPIRSWCPNLRRVALSWCIYSFICLIFDLFFWDALGKVRKGGLIVRGKISTWIARTEATSLLAVLITGAGILKRGWTPVRAIVRLQKQAIRYQGSICQTCVSVRRTLALWKPVGGEGTSVKGACVSARFKCKTSSRERDFTSEGQGSCGRNLFAGEHLLFFSLEHVNENTLRLHTGNGQELHSPIPKRRQHIPQFYRFNSLVKIYNSTCKLEPFIFF